MTPTTLYQHEKAPLLPTNNSHQGCCQPSYCQHQVEQLANKTKYHYQGYLFLLFIFLFSLQNGYLQYICNKAFYSAPHNNNTEICVAGTKIYHTDITAQNQVQMAMDSSNIQADGSCANGLDVPYGGLTKWEFDVEKFDQLAVQQNLTITQGNYKGSISYANGETKVYVDESVSKATVALDLKFSSEEIRDLFWIEEAQDEETGAFSLIIKNNQADVNGCVKIDVTIRLPSIAALKRLDIALIDSEVSIGEGLKFNEKVTVSVVNGFVSLLEEEEGISFGSAEFSIVNGHVSGTVSSLRDSLIVNLVQGHSRLVVKEIDQSARGEDSSIPIKVSIVNGHAYLQVPVTFESKFKLSSIIGKRGITSTDLNKLHVTSIGWFETKGYYGSDPQTQNSIKLSGTNAEFSLSYA